MRSQQLAILGRYLETDELFNSLYPPDIQMMAKRHWTPLHIVKIATEFLRGGLGTKVLDIGSGAGKFCLAAALYNPNVDFYGVEQRDYLVQTANSVKNRLKIDNAYFVEGNFTQLNLGQFDHFYFFNSFYENLDDNDRIDETINYSEALYEYYVRYLRAGLRTMPVGTKIVTYHSLNEEVPREYRLVETMENGELNFWVRK